MDDLMHLISYWNKPLLISPSKGELNRIANQIPIIDVRTPKEYEKGHIPSASNIPLFSNEERAIVGTKYRKESRDTALQEALDFVAVKTDFYLDELHKIVSNKQEILVHCWRGGLRSAGMAKLFQADGYKVHVLTGGYKAYRNHVRQSIDKKAKLIIIGGMTGSGKTEILREIGKLGEQILDLEKIAHHKGSAFGALGQEEQPTNEQFENNLFEDWKKLDLSKRIWLEDESQLIGKVRIPDPLFKQMRITTVIKLELKKDIRVDRLLKEYTGFDTKPLIDSITNISRRLGGLDTRKAIEAVEKSDFRTAIDIVLSYYDKTYTYGLGKRKDQTVLSLELNEDNPGKSAEKVIDLALNIGGKKRIMIKESKDELKARVIRLDMNETDYQQILGGPPDSVTMRSGLVRLSPGTSVGVHNTNGYEELIVVLEGKGEMRVTGQDSLTIGKSSAAYCPPETEHNVVNTGDDVLKYVYIVAMAK